MGRHPGATTPNVRGLLAVGLERLRVSGSPSARLDVELLLAMAVGIDRTGILAHSEAPVGAGAAERYEAALVRREAGEPVAYIRGFKEFHGLAFATDRRALIPRPETELVVEVTEAEVVRRLTRAPRAAGTAPVRVVDVGTGAGTIVVAVAVALRRRRMLDEVELWATDSDAEALRLARENAVGHGVADRVQFIEADLLPTAGRLAGAPAEVIAANLPYVASAEVDRLPVAASYEPRGALDGGPDGLAVIRRLVELLPAALVPGGTAILEIGADQGAAVASLAGEHAGWTCEILPDLAGRPRVARLTVAGSHGVDPRVG